MRRQGRTRGDALRCLGCDIATGRASLLASRREYGLSGSFALPMRANHGRSRHKKAFMKPSGEPAVQVEQEVRVRWSELDILRGLAVIFMIANHLGVSTPAGENSPPAWFVTFLGSMAPVLFFLVTGLGYGVGSVRKAGNRGDKYLTKFAVLYAADAFLWLRPGVWLGNDFLGFIAISGLLLEGIRRLRRSLSLSLVLAVLAITMRFGLGPFARTHFGLDYDGGWVPFCWESDILRVFRIRPVPGWLSLLGICRGTDRRLTASKVVERRIWLGLGLLLIGLSFSAVGAWMVWRGSVLFRWGTMSASFFLITLGVVSICLAVSLFLGRKGTPSWLGRLIMLSGVRSFAIVPIHYLYRDLSLQAGFPVENLAEFMIWLVVAVPLCYECSKLVPAVTGLLQKPRLQRAARSAIVLGTVVCAILLATGPVNQIAGLLLRSVTQLALCVLFGLVSGRPAAPPVHAQGCPAGGKRNPYRKPLPGHTIDVRNLMVTQPLSRFSP